MRVWRLSVLYSSNAAYLRVLFRCERECCLYSIALMQLISGCCLDVTVNVVYTVPAPAQLISRQCENVTANFAQFCRASVRCSCRWCRYVLLCPSVSGIQLTLLLPFVDFADPQRTAVFLTLSGISGGKEQNRKSPRLPKKPPMPAESIHTR